MKRIFGATILSAFFSLQALADVVVVVHPDNAAELSSKSVQRIFLGKAKRFSTGEATTPVNRTAGDAIRTEFDQDLLGRSTAQVAAYWSKLVFTGKGVPPQELSTDAEVIELIKQNKNVIGYIDSSSVTADVKVVNLD